MRYFVAVVLVAGVFAAAGCGKRSVATVNGTKITQDAFYKRLQRFPVSPNIPFPPDIRSQAATATLNQMIIEELFLGLAKKENVYPTEQQLKERKQELQGDLADRGRDLNVLLNNSGMSHKELDERLLPQLAQANVLAKYIKVTDADINKAYQQATTGLPANQKFRSRFYLPVSVHVYGILNRDKVKIMEAKKSLDNNVAFAAVAERYTTDQFTKGRRGEIGWIDMPDPVRPPARGVPEAIYRVAFSTKPGTTSEPFQAGQDWVILRVEERRPARMQPLKNVRSFIRNSLLQQKSAGNPRIEKLFGELRKNAKIDVTIPGYRELFKNIQDQLQKAKVGPQTQPSPTPDQK